MTLHVAGSAPVWAILVLLIVRYAFVRTQSPSVTWLMTCCAFVVIGLGVNEPFITDKLASLFNTPNVADVVGRCFMVAGLFALAQSVEAAADKARLFRPSRFIVCGIVLASMVALFLEIKAPHTTDQFMQTYGAQVPTGLYSAVEMTYVAIIIGIAARAVFGELTQELRPSRIYWGFILGAAGLMVLAAIAIAMDAAHVVGQLSVVAILAPVYNVVFLLSMVLLALGAAAPVLISARHEYKDWKQAAQTIADLEPKLRELEIAAKRSGLYFEIPYSRAQWRRRLHRLVLEIEDRAREASLPLSTATDLNIRAHVSEAAR